MSHRFTKLLTHVVFGTKERRPFIATAVRQELYPYLGGILRQCDCSGLKIGGTADHVHLLILSPPSRSIAEIVRLVKANSSKWIHAKWPNQYAFAWQSGYGAFSVSQSSSRAVARYIESQDEHHRVQSFEEELVALLEKHGVSYDRTELWA